MKTAIAALVLTAVSAFGMAQKPKISLRFHVETNATDTPPFAMPAKLLYQQRNAMLSSVPVLSERDLKAIFPFKTADGSWGCVFQFGDQGRMRLEQMSSEQRGKALVFYIGTKNGKHQVTDMLVDRPVTNGRITVSRGISEIEVHFMKGQFKVLGAETKAEKSERERKEKEAKKKGNADWAPNATPASPAPLDPRRSDLPVPDRRNLRDLDQPRLGD